MTFRAFLFAIFIVTLLFYTAEAYCETTAQRPAFISKLPFVIEHWDVMNVIPDVYYTDRGDRFAYQLQYAEISPSGKYLLWARIGIAFWDQRIDFYQVKDGTVINSKYIADNLEYITRVAWDTANEEYIYSSITEVKNNKVDFQSFITHQRWDGAEMKRLSRETENATLLKVSSDGKWLLARISPYPRPSPYNAEKYEKYILISTDNPEDRVDADWARIFPTISPDTKLAVTYRGQVITFYNRQTSRQVQEFSVDQTLLLNPLNREEIFSAIAMGPWWLYDSSGVLVNVSTLQKGVGTIQTLWHIKTNGEVYLLTKDVKMIAHSENGRHWLFASDSKWYFLTLKN